MPPTPCISPALPSQRSVSVFLDRVPRTPRRTFPSPVRFGSLSHPARTRTERESLSICYPSITSTITNQIAQTLDAFSVITMLKQLNFKHKTQSTAVQILYIKCLNY